LHAATSHHEHLERRLELVVGHADHVDVVGAVEHHLLGLESASGGVELVSQLRCLLVLLPARGLAHLAIEPLHHRLGVAAQEVGERIDVGAVGLVGDAGDLGNARPATASDVEVEARSLRSGALIEERVGTRAHREDTRQGIERVSDRPRVTVRSEVADLLALRASEHLGARPLLTDRQR
jgi:hypothetical protein